MSTLNIFQTIQDLSAQGLSKAEVIEKFQSIFSEKLESDNDYLAKAIAAYIRLAMEDFHSKELSDEQMKTLNPIIRNAIFTFMEDFAQGHYSKIYGVVMPNLPDYWEDCKYLDELH